MFGKQKQAILFFFKVSIALLIFWVLAQHAELQLKLLNVFLISPISTLVIVILCYFMVILHAWRWHRLNYAQKIDVGFGETIMPTYLGVAFNTILPGSVGGDIIRLYYIIRKFPQQKMNAAFAVVVDRISGLLGIFILGCILAPYYLARYHQHALLHSILLVSFIVCVATMCVFFLLLTLSVEKIGFLNKMMQLANNYALLQPLVRALRALGLYKNAKWIMIESILVSIVTQMSLLLVLVIISHLMALPTISLMDYLLALVIAQVANLVPITPGGVGIGEAAFANVISILHPSITAGYATVFFALRLISAIAYFPGIIIGIFGKHLYGRKAAVISANANV